MADEKPFEKNQRNLRLSIDVDDQLTWGELFRFVDLARQSGVDPDGSVGLQYNERDVSILDGMYVYLDSDELPAGGSGQ